LASFERYLLTERALAAGTVRGYVDHSRWFLNEPAQAGWRIVCTLTVT